MVKGCLQGNPCTIAAGIETGSARPAVQRLTFRAAGAPESTGKIASEI